MLPIALQKIIVLYRTIYGYFRCVAALRCVLNSVYLITVFSSSNDNLKDLSTIHFIRVFFRVNIVCLIYEKMAAN